MRSFTKLWRCSNIFYKRHADVYTYTYTYTYMHTHAQALCESHRTLYTRDIHTCIHAYIHAYIHTYLHTYIHHKNTPSPADHMKLSAQETYIHTYTYLHIHTQAYAKLCGSYEALYTRDIHTYTYMYIHRHTPSSVDRMKLSTQKVFRVFSNTSSEVIGLVPYALYLCVCVYVYVYVPSSHISFVYHRCMCVVAKAQDLTLAAFCILTHVSNQ